MEDVCVNREFPPPYLDLLPSYCGSVHLSDGLFGLLTAIENDKGDSYCTSKDSFNEREQFVLGFGEMRGSQSCPHLFVIVGDEGKAVAGVVHVDQPPKLTELCLVVSTFQNKPRFVYATF